MFLIMSYTSASKLLSSSFCGGHFLDLKPKLLSMALLLSSLSLSRFVLFLSLFCSKNNLHNTSGNYVTIIKTSTLNGL